MMNKIIPAITLCSLLASTPSEAKLNGFMPLKDERIDTTSLTHFVGNALTYIATTKLAKKLNIEGEQYIGTSIPLLTWTYKEFNIDDKASRSDLFFNVAGLITGMILYKNYIE